MEFVKGVTAGAALLGAIGSAKTAFGDQPEPPQIPETKPPAAAPTADPMAARYAQQRKTAARAGSRRETFLAGRKRPGAMNTMLG